MLNKIVKRRKELKITQKEMAKKIGISATQYNLVENGKRNTSFSTFERLLNELGLNMLLTEYNFSEEDLVNLGKLLKK
jgi:transcriptional regulator with XRE-family HTH domain